MSLSKKLDKLFMSEFKGVTEEEIDEMNVTGGGEAYDTPKAFATGSVNDDIDESAFKSLSKQMFLNEAKYREYKNDTTFTSRQKVNKSIKEVNSKLFKIERILDQNTKLKTESGIDESKYWQSTKRNLLKIEQKMIRLAEKLRSF